MKARIGRFYSNKDAGRFIAYIESTKKSGINIGKFTHLGIANIFKVNLEDIKKIEKKGINRITVEFRYYYEKIV